MAQRLADIRRRVKRMVRDGELTPDSDLIEVPYIGEYLSERLAGTRDRLDAPFLAALPATFRRRRFRKVNDLLRYFAGQSQQTAIDRVSFLLRNKRPNTCVRTSSQRRDGASTRGGRFTARSGNRRAAQATPEFHVRDVNLNAWTAVGALFKGFRQYRNRRTLPQLPIDVVRTDATAFCGCIRSARGCERHPSCRFDDGVCRPARNESSRRTFRGLAGLAGQTRVRNAPAVRGRRYGRTAPRYVRPRR